MSSNKTIAKNTFFLYIRMFFNMGVSLVVARVALQVLGVTDYGIYDLVGGVVVLFSFLNNSMGAATQRFINFEKASGTAQSVNKIFNISLFNHVLIVLAFFILAETFGLWFLNNKLNVPSERLEVTNYVYQFSVLTTMIGILRTPYYAMILAYERMSYYAFVGIAETLCKLLIVYLLYVFRDSDSLLLYAGFLTLLNIAFNIVMFVYCRRNFKEETKFAFYKDIAKIKELLSFSSWMLFGQLAFVLATHGMSIILNLFHGVIINAALGIANQVNAALYSFVGNFQTAFNPQIVQSYASNELDRNRQLILSTSKYSFFLMCILAGPVLFFTHGLLTVWLGNNLPDYVEPFVRVIIFCSLIDALAGPFWMSASAIAKVKEYNIPLTVINFLTLPIAYFLLKIGYSPISVYIGKLIVAIVMQSYRYYFVDKYLKFKTVDTINYFKPIILLYSVLAIIVFYANDIITFSLMEMVLGSIVIMFGVMALIYVIGLNKEEKFFIKNLINNRLKKFSNT